MNGALGHQLAPVARGLIAMARRKPRTGVSMPRIHYAEPAPPPTFRNSWPLFCKAIFTSENCFLISLGR
jgi:hypothetical protein